MKYFLLLLFFPAIICSLYQELGRDPKFLENEELKEALVRLNNKITTLSATLEEHGSKIKELEEKDAIQMERLKNKELQIEQLQKQVDEFRRNINSDQAKATEVPTYTDMNLDIQGHDSASKDSNKTVEERLANLELLTTLRSCYEYSMFGISTSGTYAIDPDGPLMGDEPFEVFCRFENGIAITEIIHDKDEEVNIIPCADPFCFSLELQYPTTMDQITAIKDISESCTQDITYGCFLSGLSLNDNPIGEWINQNGDPEIYFTGANHNTHICECGVQGNCSGSAEDYLCNCDYQIPIIQEDAGTITDMSALPILGFKYGMMEYDSQMANIRIGRLQCRGKKSIEPNLLTESCQNMKTQGIMTSGHYILNDQSIVYCNMAKPLSDSKIQTHVGHLSYSDVMFIVTRTLDQGCIDTGIISFDEKVVDRSNNFNIQNGVFVSPKKGSYFFQFNSRIANGDSCEIQVYVNYEKVMYFYENDTNQLANFYFTIELETNDELWLSLSGTDTLYVTPEKPLTFMGYLVN